jgi:hypothetical protein
VQHYEYQLYQQFRAQAGSRPGPTFLADVLRDAHHPAFQLAAAVVDGMAVAGRMLADAGRAAREQHFGKAAEKAQEWRDAPTGAIKHLPPGGDPE